MYDNETYRELSEIFCSLYYLDGRLKPGWTNSTRRPTLLPLINPSRICLIFRCPFHPCLAPYERRRSYVFERPLIDSPLRFARLRRLLTVGARANIRAQRTLVHHAETISYTQEIVGTRMLEGLCRGLVEQIIGKLNSFSLRFAGEALRRFVDLRRNSVGRGDALPEIYIEKNRAYRGSSPPTRWISLRFTHRRRSQLLSAICSVLLFPKERATTLRSPRANTWAPRRSFSNAITSKIGVKWDYLSVGALTSR